MRRTTTALSGLLLMVWTVAGCGGGATDGERRASSNPKTNEQGIDRRNLDETTAPCEDFYQYANGTWLTNNPIPEEESSWGISDEMRERNYVLLRDILDEAAAAKAAQGSNRQKVGDFWKTGMDSEAIASAGIEPLRVDLDRITAAETVDDIVALVRNYHREGISPLFDFGILNDLMNPEIYRAYAVQGGLGLPDRDYYTREDEESVELRGEYEDHVARMLALLGTSEEDAARHAAAILALETRLAEVSLTRVEQRNPATFYNIQTIDYADGQTDHFSWTAYFDTMGIGQLDDFSYAHPKFFAEMNAALADTPVEIWQAYLRWHLVNALAPFLSDDVAGADFDFYGRTLQGTEAQRPRWKRVIDQTSASLGEALGEVYVAKAFPPETKRRADEMIENLRAAVRDRLQALPWMGDTTKAAALSKLEAFTTKIGYPDEWRDYSALTIGTDSYVSNVRAANAFETKRDLDKIGQPIDRNEWGMAPQEINAYYNPLQTEIVFPAAIMQPPVFDGEIDDAVNYGAMGGVIGHEFMHGFDDQGSRFSADGSMRNWWTDEDRANFEERTQRLVEQYSGYTVADGLNVNGELTLGENIGDLAGITMAYYALQKALEESHPGEIDGFTPEQRFFLSWAQAWRRNYRNEAIKLQVNTDPHSPSRFRANGPLANMPEFAAAFGCEPGDPMVRDPELRAEIW